MAHSRKVLPREGIYFPERQCYYRYKAKKVKDYMSNDNIDVLPWPAYIPDLDPI